MSIQIDPYRPVFEEIELIETILREYGYTGFTVESWRNYGGEIILVKLGVEG